MTWDELYDQETSYIHSGDIDRDVAAMLWRVCGYDAMINKPEIMRDFGVSFDEAERLADAWFVMNVDPADTEN